MNYLLFRIAIGVLPLALFCLYIPFSSSIDLAIANRFVQEDGRFHAPSWCLFIYNYGLIPGQLLFVGAFFTCVYILWNDASLAKLWPALYIVATLSIGSGLIGHGVFKQFWNRPRPKQVVLFGGKYPYCPLDSRYTGPKDRFLRSLPSGHATMGFYFLTLLFLGRRLSKKWLQRLGLSLSILIGGLLTYARLAQGGHFVSDIIVSLLIMWIVAYWLDFLMYEPLTQQFSQKREAYAKSYR